MVQVLPYVPSFGERLAPILSQVGQSIGENRANRNRKIESQRPHAQSFLTSLLKQQGADAAYDPDQLLKARKRADEYISKGYDSTQAVFAAYEDLVGGFPEKGAKNKSETAPGETLPDNKSSQESVLNKPITPFLGRLSQFLQSPLQAATQAPLDKLIEAAKTKPEKILKESKESLAKKNEGRPEDTILQKIVGATGLPWLQKLVQGLDPTGLVQKGEEALAEKGLSVFPKENQLSQISNKGAEATGEVLKDLLLYKGAGAAKTIPGKVASAAGLFGAQKGVKTAVTEGRAPTVGEVGSAAAFGAGGELAGPIVKAGLGFIKKIPKVYESLKSVVTGAKGALTEEKIVQQAVKNLESRGISVVKAAEGDSKALNEIQKESSKVADTYKQADKFNRKELEKVRGEKAEKLVQSPLEKYYAPVKEVEHRAETLAKQAERIKPLELKIKQSERSLRNLQYEILNSENYLNEAAHKLNEAERQRVQALIDHNKLQHQKQLNEIRSAEFEIKYGKPPATTEQIKEQIAKSFDEIRAGIKDPSIDKIKKLEKAIEQNKEAVDQAQKLIERGELPGRPVFDEFIKIKQEYVKAYGDLIDELGTFIKESKGEKALASEVQNAQKLKQLIQQTREQARSSIVNQIDKRKAMKTLEGPSGALWKNLLKDVRKDVDAFQKQWVSYNKTPHGQQIKPAHVAKKTFEAQKPIAAPKPLAAAEEAKSVAIKKKADSELKNEVNAFHERLKIGKTTEKDIVKAGNATSKYLKRLQSIPKGFAKGAIAGVIQSIFEEYTGSKIPIGLVSVFIPGSAVGRGSAFGGTIIGHKIANGIFDHIEVEKLKKLRNTEEFHKYRKDLERRYSKARVNRLVKASGQSK